VGSALTDPNFNRLNGVEGSGTDEVRFHIPVTGYTGELHVAARIMYQSVPPKWLEEMFAVDHPTINAFEQMYNEEGADPVQVGLAETTALIVGVGEKKSRFVLMPNPTTDGRIRMDAGNELIQEVLVYSNLGQLVERRSIQATSATFQLPDAPGNYMLCIITNRGKRIEKVLRQ
jgi:hypothetical protein